MNYAPINTELPRTTLGLFIREKRMALRMSLRAFADMLTTLLAQSASEMDNSGETRFSAGFLSDIEKGYRFPSDRVLSAIAVALDIPVQELRDKDQRMPTDDLQRLQTLNPQYGFAFRRAVDYINRQNLSPQDVLERICNEPPPDNK